MLPRSKAGIPILLYHSIDDSGSSISVAPNEFRRHMRSLYEKGFSSLSISEALSRLGSAISALPQDGRCVVITFDDGYRSTYTHGLPILEQYGFKATVFLTSGLCGREISWKHRTHTSPKFRMLSWNEVKLMSRCGMEIGAHTHMHPNLAQLPLHLAQDEIRRSKIIIEHNLGKAVDVFAYPFGLMNESVESEVRSSFQAACTTYPGLLTVLSNPYRLPRLLLDGYLARFLSAGFLLDQFAAPYIACGRAIRTLVELKGQHGGQVDCVVENVSSV